VKALLDEQLSPQIAAVLRERGHDVIAVADRPEPIGATDRTILDTAAAEHRAVITNNIKDFRPLAAERIARGQSHSGLILLPSTHTRTRAAADPLAVAIAAILERHPDGLHSSERWVAPLADLLG
jgi:predicted nuclease of predicted toxin-antitoxin system